MSNNLKEPTKEIIPVSTAIRRTTAWRNFLADNTDTQDKRKLPKAVYISKADIEDLAASCRADDSITGVRAYFTLNNELVEEIKNDIKFVMVLVRESATLPFGQDVIYLPGSLGDGDDDSNIYDFTKPCPDYCDPTSPLFGDGDGGTGS